MSSPPYRLYGNQSTAMDPDRERLARQSFALESYRHRPIATILQGEPKPEPHSASVIRDLEVFINGRVLSPAPKEGT